MAITIREIRAQLDRLRTADPKYQLFGAKSHRYKLNAPLAGESVARFEQKHGITLPIDYWAFMQELGNGGAGPFYGIFPLGEWDEGVWEEEHGLVGRLSSPFPHQTVWNLPVKRLEPPESFDSNEEEDEWHQKLDAEYYDSTLVNGAIPICHHGCALRTWLVVTGPERGHVWFDGRAQDTGIAPHQGNGGERLTFGDWYAQWLNQSLAELRVR